MRHTTLTFANIMETNLLYYDSAMEDVIRAICQQLRIDYFPSFDGKSKYRMDEKGIFREEEIHPNEKVTTSDPIFQEGNLDKFRKSNHNVLFVYDRDHKAELEMLCGVVHVSDYNRDAVLTALQEDLLKFERLLRQYLILIGKKNEDMLRYFREKAKKDGDFKRKLKRAESKKGQEAIEKLGPFQTFDLRDLLFFIQSSRNKVPLKMATDAPERLGDLRNLAMHAKNTIHLKKERRYNTESLEGLINDLKLLKKEYLNAAAKMAALPASRNMLRARNQATLDMIHQQGVSALAHLLSNV